MIGLTQRFFVILLAGGLVGCYLPTALTQSNNTKTDIPVYQTVSVLLTETRSAQNQTQVSQTPDRFTDTTRLSMTVTPIEVTLVSLATSTAPVIATRMCNLAQAGRPIDVTVPDGADFHPGDGFVKTWRLVNAGSCPWSQGYAIVWFSGDDLGLRHEEPFRNIVAPGDSIDLSVDMVAPQQPGTYQSNWKLRDEQGKFFGIGPGGGAPVWVRIEVNLENTLTPTPPEPTETPTPVVFRSGGVTLTLDQSLNFENGQVSDGAGGDLQLKLNGKHLELVPSRATRMINMGVKVPVPSDCETAPVSAEPIPLVAGLEGSTLCVQTGGGQPGNVQLGRIDTTGNTLELKYSIWSVP